MFSPLFDFSFYSCLFQTLNANAQKRPILAKIKKQNIYNSIWKFKPPAAKYTYSYPEFVPTYVHARAAGGPGPGSTLRSVLTHPLA